MRPPRTVLILGAGVGGLVAARRLRARLPHADRVVVVDRAERHLFQPSLLWVLSGARRAERIQRPLDRLAARGIDLVPGHVSAVDAATRTAIVNGRPISADAMIIALGAELAPERIPGLAVAGHNLYTADGATTFHAALAAAPDSRVAVLTAAPLYRCPAAPYEAAMLTVDMLRRRGATPNVTLYAAEPAPMGTAGPEISAAVRTMVEATGVVYRPSRQVVQADAANRTLSFTDGTRESFDVLGFVPPHVVPAALASSGLVGEQGWAVADPHTLETSAPGVYAIGDIVGIPLPSGKLLPKAGVFAHAQAEIVADAIVAAWAGRPARRTFDGAGACFIETGRGRAGFGSGNFYASPVPAMRFHRPARRWHWGKMLFEKRWLARYP